MKDGGTLLYKCRLCGELKGGMHAPHLLISLAHVSSGLKQPADWGPLGASVLHSLHNCADGRLGLADLVGGEPDR